MSKNNLEHGGSNRRTFLKTVGITLGAAGLESATVDSQETPGVPAGGWSCRRGTPDRTGVVASTGPNPYPTTEWKAHLGGTIFGQEPVVSDGTVFLPVTTNNSPPANEGFLGAYDVETGDEKWRQAEIPVPKTPTVGTEGVYLATQVTESSEPGENGLYALERGTGDFQWSRTDVQQWTEPAAINGFIYTATNEGAVALDPTSGKVGWKNEGVGGVAKGFDEQVAANEEIVFFADGTALDSQDGSVVWEIDNDEVIIGDPAVKRGHVIFIRTQFIDGTREVSLRTRSEETGKLVWEYTSPDNRWDGNHAITENCVILIEARDSTSTVIAVDILTGKEKYRTELPVAFASSPVGGDNSLYIGGQYVPQNDDGEPRACISELNRSTGDIRFIYLLDSSGLPTSPENPPAAGTPALTDGQLITGTYPAGSTLDFEYTRYSNIFTLGPNNTPPDDGHMGSHGGKSDDGKSRKLDARIDTPSDKDLSDLSPGEKVLLNGSSSTGTDLTYDWDTDGDGQYDASGQSVRVTVPACTSVTVTLRVTNENGDTDTATVTMSPN